MFDDFCVVVCMLSSTITNSQPELSVAMESSAVSEALGNVLLQEGLPGVSKDCDEVPLPPPAEPPSSLNEGSGNAAEAKSKADSTKCLVHTG